MIPKIELLKKRDFGEIISDTFLFLKQNLKPLLASFFIICGFFMLAMAVTAVMQQAKMVGIVNGTLSSSSMYYLQTRTFDAIGIEYFLTLIFTLVNYVAMHVTVYSYMALYRDKGNIAPTPEEVWGYFKYFFVKVLGSSIVLFLLLIIGFMLCFFPGIYLYPILGLVIPIMIFENTSLGFAFNKSFSLIKENWWLTFGAIFIMGIIVSISTAIVVLPVTIINYASPLLHPGKGFHLSLVMSVITAVLQSAAQVFNILALITISLCYFSMSEKTDGTGLMNRINQLGNKSDDANLPAEEY
jgi:hypothetical protein